ncbi:uncharacterized protein [Salvelinus alpinus]|uniref:uncharacterized protein isoform X4 n=1 Tax=Salvelinus alpinus TaxID=8036 RepID=UPI0039FDD76B
MRSVSFSPPAKEEEVCWTEKEGMWQNIVVKEEEGEAVTLKVEEEDAVFGVKEEEGEITVTLEEEEEVGDLFNTNKERYESQSTYEEVPMKSSGSQSWGLKEVHCCFCLSTAQLIQMINSSSSFK